MCFAPTKYGGITNETTLAELLIQLLQQTRQHFDLLIRHKNGESQG